ncbi:hypothetical protein C8R45DRAFT_1113975 [Mycena sanguinolenta]|nr:hypothetical protein C8R45DRAFT_1115898 [Mycena sanguinolenta]KAJ6450637.1 hypothetical protein C8R45DRAFT_1113975 [Mycena sanguinolenta]
MRQIDDVLQDLQARRSVYLILASANTFDRMLFHPRLRLTTSSKAGFGLYVATDRLGCSYRVYVAGDASAGLLFFPVICFLPPTLRQVLTLSSCSSACTLLCPRAVLRFSARCSTAGVLDVQLPIVRDGAPEPSPMIPPSSLAPPARGEELASVILDDFDAVSLRSDLPKPSFQ